MLACSNGITLIALIITIIVMLILLGVTINVAIEGGLFTSAKQATNDYQYEAEYETLQVAIVGALDSNQQIPNAETLQNNLPSGWSVKGEDSGPFTVTSPNGNVFTVYKDGTQTSGGEDEPDPPTEEIPDLFRKYILGQDGTGRNLMGDNGILNGSFTFLDDPLTSDVNETETLGVECLTTGLNEDMTKGFLYAKYNNKVYRITVDNQTYKSEELEMIYEPKGNEGRDLGEVTGKEEYNGWTILYDNGETVEAVSPTAIGNLELGYADTTTNWKNPEVIAEANIDGEEGLTNLEKSIYSYNHAIDIINTYCQSLEDLPTNSGVRSVGVSAETTTDKYYSSNLENSVYNGVGLKGDTNYEQDLVRMVYHGVLDAGTNYWIASRMIFFRFFRRDF